MAIMLLTAALLGPLAWSSTMVRQQELRVALAARNMANGESWLIPEFRGEARLYKPPLMYWMVAVSYLAADSTRSALAARLPSMLASCLLVVVLGIAGSPLLGRRRATLASLTALTSFAVLRYGSLAETDMTLTLFMTVATLGVYAAVSGRAPRAGWLLAGIAAGAGFLVKGPAAVAVPLLCAAFYPLVARGTRHPVRWVSVAAAVGIFLAVSMPWYVAVWIRAQGSTGAAVASELGKLVVVSEHPGPFYYYLYKLPLAMLPWGLAIPLALWWGWKHRQRPGVRFVIVWWVVAFVLLSAIRSKQEHYALMLLPPSALLLGGYWGSARHAAHRYVLAVAWLSLPLGLGLLAAPLFTATLGWGVAALAGAMSLAAAFTVWVWGRHCTEVAALATGLWLAICSALYAWVFHFEHREEAVLPAVCEASRAVLDGAERVFVVGRHAETIEFYAGRPIQRVSSVPDAWQAAKPGDAVIGISTPRHPFELRLKGHSPLREAGNKQLQCVLYQK